MATLMIMIELDNAAFTIESNDETNGRQNVGPELARILRAYASSVRDAQDADELRRTLRDINGHEIGRAATI